MTDYKNRELDDSSDINLDETVEEGMQGASGDMDANGLASGVDREEKLGELQDNLQGLTSGGGGGLPGPSDPQ